MPVDRAALVGRDGREPFSRGAGMTARARILRNDPGLAKRKLWACLRGDQLGVRFRRQLVIDQHCIVDFCAPGVGLVIGVGGGPQADAAQDALQTAYLETHGYWVLRFRDHEVLAGTETVLEQIIAAIAARAAETSSPLTPLRSGEGKHPGHQMGPDGDAAPPSPPRRGVGGEVSLPPDSNFKGSY